jgi:hypothetical protein
VSASILNVTFDCSDAASTARFWSEVTTWPCAKVEMPGNPYWVVGLSAEGALRLVFVEVPEEKTVKNRPASYSSRDPRKPSAVITATGRARRCTSTATVSMSLPA